MVTEKTTQAINPRKLAEFKKLSAAGCSSSEIMEIMGIKRRMYQYYKQASTLIDNRRKIIDPQKYFNLLRKGIANKRDLAVELGVSDKTLTQWENGNHCVKNIGSFLAFQGQGNCLKKVLRISSEKAQEICENSIDKNDVIIRLSEAISMIENMSVFCPELKEKKRILEEALKVLISLNISIAHTPPEEAFFVSYTPLLHI